MASRKARLSERQELEHTILELQAENSLLRDEVEDWKRQYRKLQKEKEETEKSIQEELKKRTETAEQLRKANTAKEAAEKKSSKTSQMLAIESRAREGQVKKVKIMEHELMVTREINDKLEKQRNIAEAKRKDFEQKWLRERSLRLQDIHKNHNITVDNKKTHQLKDAADIVMVQALKDRTEMEKTLGISEAALNAQTKITEAQQGEILGQTREIEFMKKRILDLERQVNEQDENMTATTMNASHLEGEVWRLQRELLSSAHMGSNTLRARTVSRQFTPASAHRTAKSEFLSREVAGFSRTGARSSTQSFLTTVNTTRKTRPRTVHLAPGNSQQQQAPSSGLTVNVEDGFRSGAGSFSRPGTSMHHSAQRLSSSASFRPNLSVHQDALESLSQASPASSPSKSLSMRNSSYQSQSLQTLNIEKDLGWTPSLAPSPSRQRKTVKLKSRSSSKRPDSSLGVPGSIYVGYGLGLKKGATPVYEFRTGSAKQSLKNVLSNFDETSPS